MRTHIKRKVKAQKNLRKEKVVTRCLAVRKNIIAAKLELKAFYDKKVKNDGEKIFNKAKVNKKVLMEYTKKKTIIPQTQGIRNCSKVTKGYEILQADPSKSIIIKRYDYEYEQGVI